MPGGGTDAFRTAGFELTFTHREQADSERTSFTLGLGLELVTADVDRQRRVPEPRAASGQAYDQRGLALEGLSVGAFYLVVGSAHTSLDPAQPEVETTVEANARVGVDAEEIRGFTQNNIHDASRLPWVPTRDRPARPVLDVDLQLRWGGDTQNRP